MFNQSEQDICVLCNIEHHLGKIKRKAIKAGYQDNIMIVSGSVPNFRIGSGSDQPKIWTRPDPIRIRKKLSRDPVI